MILEFIFEGLGMLILENRTGFGKPVCFWKTGCVLQTRLVFRNQIEIQVVGASWQIC